MTTSSRAGSVGIAGPCLLGQQGGERFFDGLQSAVSEGGEGLVGDEAFEDSASGGLRS